MKLIDSLHPNNAARFYEHMRATRSVIVVFEVNDRTAGLLCGLRKDDEIEVAFTESLVFSFDLEGAAKDNNLKMLAWRDWEGAWRVLDPRVSALLPTVDTYAEGD